MKTLALAFLLCGCERVPEPTFYFLSETVERDGVTFTRVFSGPSLPLTSSAPVSTAVSASEP